MVESELRTLLAQVRRQRPDLPESEVRWGQLLLEAGAADEFLEWNRGVTRAVAEHPEVWLLRGRFARQRDERPVAARCFWEALRRDPTNRAAHDQLGRVLEDLDQHAVAAPMLDRAELLQQLAVGRTCTTSILALGRMSPRGFVKSRARLGLARRARSSNKRWSRDWPSTRTEQLRLAWVWRSVTRMAMVVSICS